MSLNLHRKLLRLLSHPIDPLTVVFAILTNYTIQILTETTVCNYFCWLCYYSLPFLNGLFLSLDFEALSSASLGALVVPSLLLCIQHSKQFD